MIHHHSHRGLKLRGHTYPNPYPDPAEHADCSVSEMRLMIIPHLFMRAIFWLNSVSMHLERAKTRMFWVAVTGCTPPWTQDSDSDLRTSESEEDRRTKRRGRGLGDTSTIFSRIIFYLERIIKIETHVGIRSPSSDNPTKAYNYYRQMVSTLM